MSTDGKDAFAEFDAMFADVVVPATITKPKKQPKQKEGETIEEFRAKKIAKINEWISKLETDMVRPTGRGGKANLSVLTVDPAFISVKLPHGPAGNLNLYFKGVWKSHHIIPTATEVPFWKGTIMLIENGRYDEIFEAAKKTMIGIFRNEDGAPKERKPRKKKEDAVAV